MDSSDYKIIVDRRPRALVRKGIHTTMYIMPKAQYKSLNSRYNHVSAILLSHTASVVYDLESNEIVKSRWGGLGTVNEKNKHQIQLVFDLWKEYWEKETNQQLTEDVIRTDSELCKYYIPLISNHSDMMSKEFITELQLKGIM